MSSILSHIHTMYNIRLIYIIIAIMYLGVIGYTLSRKIERQITISKNFFSAHNTRKYSTPCFSHDQLHAAYSHIVKYCL